MLEPSRQVSRRMLLTISLLCASALCADTLHAEEPALLLVSSGGSDEVVAFDPHSGEWLGAFVAAGSGGMKDPDSMSLGPDGALYVSSGRDATDSAVLRFDAKTGEFLGVFARDPELVRPYGQAWGPDGLFYVSSFLTDKILRFDAVSGDLVDVFASGTGAPGGANGPNGLAFGPDGKLYVATEGSVAGEFPGLPSEVLRFDVRTGAHEVFVAQPVPAPSGAGYVSLLGLAFGPNCRAGRRGSCDLFVSDFANDIRRYGLDGRLKAQLPTNYTGASPSDNATGSLAFAANGVLFAVGFDLRESESARGAVLRFDGVHTDSLWVAPTDHLVRPIGVLLTGGARSCHGQPAAPPRH